MFSSKTKKELNLYKYEFHKLKDDYDKKTNLLEHYKQKSARQDSVYYNLRTGSGTVQDSNESTTLKPFTQYSFQTLENLAACDPIISKILQTIVQSVFKNEFNIVTKNKDYFKKFKKIWDDFGLDELTYDGYDSGNVFGHAFLLLDLDDGLSYTDELDFKKIKKINNIKMINRYFFAPDPTERNFKFDPVYYYLVQQPIYSGLNINNEADLKIFAEQVQTLAKEKIHYTRMLPFWGKKLKPYLFRTNLHFHDTYIRKIEQAAKNYHIAMDNLSTVMSKIPYAIAKIENLSNVLSDPEQRQNFSASMSVREQVRSTNNISVMDTKENYELYSPTLAGYGEAIDKIERRLCFSCDIPHDVLFGEGSTGSTTGRTEKTNFERFIQSEQRIKIAPKVKFFMELFEAVYGLKIPNDFEIVFDHSETPTQIEESQTLLNNANAANILAEQGFDCSEYITTRYPQIIKDQDFSEMEKLINE
jgi:phage-related protein (TIGR01555 family)